MVTAFLEAWWSCQCDCSAEKKTLKVVKLQRQWVDVEKAVLWSQSWPRVSMSWQLRGCFLQEALSDPRPEQGSSEFLQPGVPPPQFGSNFIRHVSSTPLSFMGTVYVCVTSRTFGAQVQWPYCPLLRLRGASFLLICPMSMLDTHYLNVLYWVLSSQEGSGQAAL